MRLKVRAMAYVVALKSAPSCNKKVTFSWVHKVVEFRDAIEQFEAAHDVKDEMASQRHIALCTSLQKVP